MALANRLRGVRLDTNILWRAALAQLLLVAAVSLVLAALLPRSFFEDWGWITGPVAWFGCAAVTAWALNMPMRGTLLGALLAGIVSGIAVLLGIHWLGLALAIGAFAAWCAWLPGARVSRPGLRRAES